jgi:methylmalonyl-CoA/ethylmalonyl-CoA epimerase
MKFALIPVGDDEIEIIEGDQEGYHIALQVDEIEQAIEKLKEKGIKMIDEKPWVGVHGYKIAFTDPESTKGISIELCEH